MQWQLTLDQPYYMSSEDGWTKAVQARDFSPLKDSFSNTWRDPVTGCVMLRPRLLDHDYMNDMVASTQWTQAANYWRPLKRSSDGAPMIGTVKPTGTDPTLINIALSIAIIAILVDGTLRDDLYWALQSMFLLQADEGFALHYHGVSDSMLRKKNWFAVQWDNLYLHFSQDGHVRAYLYDRSDMTAAPTLFEEFEIASPGDLAGSDGFLWFIPMPSVGLVIYHNYVQQGINNLLSNVQQTSSRGHLLQIPSKTMSDGTFRLFESSKVAIALNPYQDYAIGFQRIRYAATGTYTDAVFDPEAQLHTLPTTTMPAPLNANTFRVGGECSVSMALQKGDNSGAWSVTTDPKQRQARAQITLTSTSTVYTPFLYGYLVQWDPQITNRATTPIVLNSVTQPGNFTQNKLTRLECTDDYLGRFEGSADFILEDAGGMHIGLRGDASFLLRYSTNGGGSWVTYAQGFAKDFDIEAVKLPQTKLYFTGKCKLIDWTERLRECHRAYSTSFDTYTPGDAINVILNDCGFPRISPLPAATTAFQLPAPVNAQGWKLTPREGDSGLDIVKMLLAYLKMQYVEWILKYDYTIPSWSIVKRNRTGNAWTLSPYSADRSFAGNVWDYSEMKLRPESPEGNFVIAEGCNEAPDATNGTQARIPSQPLVNYDSLNNTDSFDYLGRIKYFKATFYPCSDQGAVNVMARRLFAAVSDRRLSGTIKTNWLQMALVPDTPLTVLDEARVAIGTFWIRRRTILIEEAQIEHDGEQFETMELEVDSVWEGDSV